MNSTAAVPTNDDVRLRMDVHDAADTAEVVSPERRQHADLPRLRAPDLQLPGPVHGAGEKGVGEGGMPGQSERGEPPARVVVVFDLTLGDDVLQETAGVVEPQCVVTTETGHLVSSLAGEHTAGQRPGVTQQLAGWLHQSSARAGRSHIEY